MRLNYYRFPEDSNPEDRFAEGCSVVLKSGRTIYPETIPEERKSLIDHIDDTLEGISISHAKELLKKYGGCAWTEHIDRDGSVFETSEITLSGNNSKFKYNQHL